MATLRKRVWQTLVLTFVFYTASFALPVLGIDFLGIHAFVYAFFYCVCLPVTGLSWFANVALWIGFAYLNSERWPEARRCGLAGVALGLTVIPFWWNQETLQVGYYVWLSSMGILTVGALHCEALERNLTMLRRRRVAEWRAMHGDQKPWNGGE
jgi:hypothetical protein